MSVAMPYAGYPYGYSPVSGETLARSTGDIAPPDLKESFAIGPVTPPSHRFADADEEFAWSPNLWPSDLPDMRYSWANRYQELSALAARLLSLMAVALDLPPNHFESMIDRHTSAMRAINYPGGQHLNGDVGAVWGASAHTDYGTLTILEVDPTARGSMSCHLPERWSSTWAMPWRDGRMTAGAQRCIGCEFLLGGGSRSRSSTMRTGTPGSSASPRASPEVTRPVTSPFRPDHI